jgi:hypothetical protein
MHTKTAWNFVGYKETGSSKREEEKTREVEEVKGCYLHPDRFGDRVDD